MIILIMNFYFSHKLMCVKKHVFTISDRRGVVTLYMYLYILKLFLINLTKETYIEVKTMRQYELVVALYEEL